MGFDGRSLGSVWGVAYAMEIWSILGHRLFTVFSVYIGGLGVFRQICGMSWMVLEFRGGLGVFAGPCII